MIGRLLKGKDTLGVIEGIDEYRKLKGGLKDKIRSMPGSLGTELKPRKPSEAPIEHSQVQIANCGVYKFE